MTYVALLRGINVGGRNKLSMESLKKTFKKLGFTKVTSYINSGNVVFNTDNSNEASITSEIERAIKQEHKLSINVIVRTADNMKLVADSMPTTWVNNSKTKTNIMFLWPEVANKNILDEITITDYDEVRYVPGALIWRVEKANLSKSGMMKLVGNKLYKKMTIRNANTVRKIAQLMLH